MAHVLEGSVDPVAVVFALSTLMLVFVVSICLLLMSVVSICLVFVVVRFRDARLQMVIA